MKFKGFFCFFGVFIFLEVDLKCFVNCLFEVFVIEEVSYF